MRTFVVKVKEVWEQPVEIEAHSKKEAMDRVENGEGNYLEKEFEYDYTLESDFWSIEEK